MLPSSITLPNSRGLHTDLLYHHQMDYIFSKRVILHSLGSLLDGLRESGYSDDMILR